MTDRATVDGDSFSWAFGSRIRSGLSLPELHEAPPGPARWEFRVVGELEPAESQHLLGAEPIYGQVSAKLYRHSFGHRITVDDTGTYDLDGENRQIRWCPNPDPWWDFGRSHLLGRVLATSLQLSGIATFHGSAVETRDGVVGFLAPKHVGKSTLAMRLYSAGARFVTDDSLALDTVGEIKALPGIQSVRVRVDDSAAQKLVSEMGGAAAGRDGKVVLPPLPEDRTLSQARNLAALYFLRPASEEGGRRPACERSMAPPMEAVVRLLGHTKIGTMLGSQFAGELLRSAAAVSTAVPVYDLSVVRNINRLPEVVDQLLGWHGLPSPQ